MIKKVACNFTVLRFLPYAETGEFVNIGIAIACPDLHWFGFKLETKRTDRIMDFFPELKTNKNLFLEGRKTFKDELARLETFLNLKQKQENQLHFREDAKLFNQVFLNLVRHREETFCFAPPQTCLTDDPEAELAKLFHDYVERGFAQHIEYQETVMTKKLRHVFHAKKILDLMPYTFTDQRCQVHFPFVRQVEQKFKRAIHPINFDRGETPKIVEHADRWRNRLVRLQKANEQPENILLVVRKPTTGPQKEVCEEMCDEIQQAVKHIAILPQEDNTEILSFARLVD